MQRPNRKTQENVYIHNQFNPFDNLHEFMYSNMYLSLYTTFQFAASESLHVQVRFYHNR